MATYVKKAFGSWATLRAVANGSEDSRDSVIGGPAASAAGWFDCQGGEKLVVGAALVGAASYDIEIWLMDLDENIYQADDAARASIAYNWTTKIDLEGDYKAFHVFVPTISANSVTLRAKVD